MILIPAVDILKGKAVRLNKGMFNDCTVYYDNAAEPVNNFIELGFRRLHLVDLEASLTGKSTILELLNSIEKPSGVIFQVGGGVRTISDAEALLKAGADRLITGSIPLLSPGLFEEMVAAFTPGKFTAALDIFHGKVRIKGWTETAAKTPDEVIEYFLNLGVNENLCTDISRDGTLEGPSVNLYKNIMAKYPQAVLIASGGIGKVEDIYTLENSGITMAVTGKMIYENKITKEELKKFAG